MERERDIVGEVSGLEDIAGLDEEELDVGNGVGVSEESLSGGG